MKLRKEVASRFTPATIQTAIDRRNEITARQAKASHQIEALPPSIDKRAFDKIRLPAREGVAPGKFVYLVKVLSLLFPSHFKHSTFQSVADKASELEGNTYFQYYKERIVTDTKLDEIERDLESERLEIDEPAVREILDASPASGGNPQQAGADSELEAPGFPQTARSELKPSLKAREVKTELPADRIDGDLVQKIDNDASDPFSNPTIAERTVAWGCTDSTGEKESVDAQRASHSIRWRVGWNSKTAFACVLLCCVVFALVRWNLVQQTKTSGPGLEPTSTQSLKGRVFDLDTASPIKGATVFLVNDAGGKLDTPPAITDNSGSFKFEDITGNFADPIGLRVSAPGYETDEPTAAIGDQSYNILLTKE